MEHLADEHSTPPNFTIAVGHQINTGLIGGNQSGYSLPANGPGQSSTSGVQGRISADLLQAAHEGFVSPEWMSAAARELRRHQMVFLTGGRGTGRRTAALNLLSGGSPADAIVEHLPGDLDFANWQPELEDAGGYLFEGPPDCLTKESALLTSVRNRLREAKAVMVVLLPDNSELVAGLDRQLDTAPIRCTPPLPEAVFRAKLKVTIPEEEERTRLLSRIPVELLRGLLRPGVSPRDVLDVVAAVAATINVKAEAHAVTTHIRGILARQAEHELADVLPGWLEDRRVLCTLVAAAVLEGLSRELIVEQACLLAQEIENVTHETGISERMDSGSIHAILNSHGLRTDTVRRPGRACPEERTVFVRCQWSEAILRHAWRRLGNERFLVPWLQGIGRHELAGKAGKALALSIHAKKGTGRLIWIRACATSETRESAVAAQALRRLLADPDVSREAMGQMTTWAYQSSVPLRCTVALACADRTGHAPLGQALAMLRHLIRGLEADPVPSVDRAVDAAVLNIGRGPILLSVLQKLHMWTESGEAESRYATFILPKILRRNFAWFEAAAADNEAFNIAVVLIRRTLRAKGSSGALRDVVLHWKRITAWDRGRGEVIDSYLAAVGEDRHPHIRRFLNTVNRHD